jgi:hypothetical protein
MRFERERLRAKMLDHEVMHHTGRSYSFKSSRDLVERAQTHWLSLSVCCDRHDPGLLAIGPAAQRTEPESYVEACRRILRTAALTLNIPTIEYLDDHDMFEDMGLKYRDLEELLHRVVPKCPKNTYAARAVACGVAAAAQMLELRGDLVARETKTPAKS